VTAAQEYPDRVAQANYWFNQIIEWVLLAVGAVIIELCVEIWRMGQPQRRFRSAACF
jgi:hypothetical protein